MARTRKVELSEYSEHFGRLRNELVLRDPLIRAFLDFPHYDQLYAQDVQLQRNASLEYKQFQEQIKDKWRVDVIPLPPPYEELPDKLRDEALEKLSRRQPWNLFDLLEYCKLVFPKGVRPTRVFIRELGASLTYTFNRGCVGPELFEFARSRVGGNGFWQHNLEECRSFLARGEQGHHAFPCFASLWNSNIALNRIHAVNFEVNAAFISGRNLQDIVAEIKKVLHAVFKHATHRDSMVGFLFTITPKAFLRAITAYDLHMCEGLTFAEIARRKKWSPDQVERNIKRIYRAVHRKGYTARRRRIDAPAEGIELYHCDKHAPKECPKGCEYMNNWYTRFNRASPTDTTGSGRRSR